MDGGFIFLMAIPPNSVSKGEGGMDGSTYFSPIPESGIETGFLAESLE